MHTEIVNKVLNVDGLGANDNKNTNKEVLPTRVKRNARNLENICSFSRQMVNSFDAFINKDVLLNIKTGRVASTATEHYLLPVMRERE